MSDEAVASETVHVVAAGQEVFDFGDVARGGRCVGERGELLGAAAKLEEAVEIATASLAVARGSKVLGTTIAELVVAPIHRSRREASAVHGAVLVKARTKEVKGAVVDIGSIVDSGEIQRRQVGGAELETRARHEWRGRFRLDAAFAGGGTLGGAVGIRVVREAQALDTSTEAHGAVGRVDAVELVGIALLGRTIVLGRRPVVAVLVKRETAVGVDRVGAASWPDRRLGTTGGQRSLDVGRFLFRVGFVDSVETGLLLEGAGAATAVVAAARLLNGGEEGLLGLGGLARGSREVQKGSPVCPSTVGCK